MIADKSLMVIYSFFLNHSIDLINITIDDIKGTPDAVRAITRQVLCDCSPKVYLRLLTERNKLDQEKLGKMSGSLFIQKCIILFHHNVI